MCLLGDTFLDTASHLGVKFSQKPSFEDMNGRFQLQAKRAKDSNFRVIKTTEATPTKFCTPMKTSKYPFQNVPHTDFDNLYVIWRVGLLFTYNYAFRESRWYTAALVGGQMPEKPEFWGRE